MKNYSFYIILSFFLLFFGVHLKAQDFKFLGKRTSQTINFELINNLIVFPVEVNGSELTFILDSGVSAPVVFNLSTSDSLQLQDVEKIQIRGLGTGDPIEALHSKRNRFKIGDLFSNNKDLYIIYKDQLDLSARLGITVHGMIGYDLFKDHIVTINYKSKKIIITDPDEYVYKDSEKYETFNLEFFKNKPYINAEVITQTSSKTYPVKLLIDSGGSDAIWLFEDENFQIPENSFEDFLGEGITGSIYGMRSRLVSFKLKSFEFEYPNVAYLDSVSSLYAKRFKERNGSIGGEILKRFKVIFDFPNSKITLKKNSNFEDKFKYNMSGLELAYHGKELVREKKNRASFLLENEQSSNSTNTVVLQYSYDYNFKPVYKILHVRANSPAAESGILPNDILVKINGKYAYDYNLQTLISKFQKREGDLIKVMVNRNGRELEYQFKLRNLLE